MTVSEDTGFSQRHKIGNNAIIANFVFPYIWSFHRYLQHIAFAKYEITF